MYVILSHLIIEPPDFNDPLILRKGCTVEHVVSTYMYMWLHVHYIMSIHVYCIVMYNTIHDYMYTIVHYTISYMYMYIARVNTYSTVCLASVTTIYIHVHNYLISLYCSVYAVGV